MLASQAESRAFESRIPLQQIQALIVIFVKCLFCSQHYTQHMTRRGPVRNKSCWATRSKKINRFFIPFPERIYLNNFCQPPSTDVRLLPQVKGSRPRPAWKAGQWIFNGVGIFKPREAIREQEAIEDLAIYRPNLLAGGVELSVW